MAEDGGGEGSGASAGKAAQGSGLSQSLSTHAGVGLPAAMPKCAARFLDLLVKLAPAFEPRGGLCNRFPPTRRGWDCLRPY